MSALLGSETFRVTVYRLRLDSGGYVASGYSKGRYFGAGEKLWEYDDEKGRRQYVRAPDRKTARLLAQAEVDKRMSSPWERYLRSAGV